MLIEKNKIRLLFYLSSLSVVFILLSSLNFMFIRNLKTQSETYLKNVETSIIDMKKMYIKDLVNTNIENIIITKEKITSKKIEEIKVILSTISKIFLNKTNDYIKNYFSGDLISNDILIIILDKNSKKVIYSKNYKEDINNINYDKIKNLSFSLLYSNTIESDKHLFLVGITESSIELLTKESVKFYIRKQKYIDDGYVWVNEILDYSGGDDYAVRLVHPNLPNTEGSLLSTNSFDSHGNKPYEKELDGMVNKGELFYEYYFKKMNSNEVSHKLSYAKLYKPYNWVVATGIYLDDVEELVKNETMTSLKKIKEIIFNAILLTFIALLISIFVIFLFEKRIIKLILSFQDSLNLKNQIIEEEKKIIEKIAYKDHLTGLLNRRSGITKLEEILSKCNRENQHFSVAMADIDNFKMINDTYGHEVGDLILKNFSQLIIENIRNYDSAIRWGGEEFLIILNNNDNNSTFDKLNFLRAKTEESDNFYNGINLKYTVSIGFSIYDFNNKISYEQLIKSADDNLYLAKKLGKNRVISN